MNKVTPVIRAREFYISGPRQFSERTISISELPEDQVLLQVIAAGVCGSDRMCWLGADEEQGRDAGQICLSHEAAARVLQVGAKATAYKYALTPNTPIAAGDIVALDPLASCDVLYPNAKDKWCYVCKNERLSQGCYCTQQHFASSPKYDGFTRTHLIYPADLLIHLPPQIPRSLISLVEPLAVGIRAVDFLRQQAEAYHARLRRKIPLDEMEYAVIGDGAVGLIIAHTLRGLLSVPREKLHIFGLNEKKLGQAEGFAATHLVKGDSLDEVPPEKADFVFECVGFDSAEFTISAARRLAKREGVVVELGLGEGRARLPISELVRKGITQVGLNKTRPTDMLQVVRNLRDRQYAESVLRLLPVKEISVRSAADVTHAYQLAEWNSRNEVDELFVKAVMLF